MRLLYSDGVSLGRSGPIQLLRLESNWCVVAPGLLCAVAGEQEGTALVRRLRAAQIHGESLTGCLSHGIRHNGAGSSEPRT